MKKRKEKYKGTSLMEALMAAFLLSVGMVAVAGLISSGIGHSIGSRNQVIASLLAQEGVELARNIRDNNWAGGNEGFSSRFPSSDNSSCRIDYNDSAIDCSPGLSYVLNIQNGVYSHNAGSATRFQRRISVDYLPTGGYVRIYSRVIWGSGSFPSSSNCNASTRCAYSVVSLSNWGFY